MQSTEMTDKKHELEYLIELSEKSLKKLEEYKNETEILKNDIKELKDMVKSQSTTIAEILQSQQDLKEANSLLLRPNDDGGPGDRFPLKSQEDLERFEEDLNETNQIIYEQFIKALLPFDLMGKYLTRVFSIELILEYNVDGVQGKRRLLDYPKILSCLHKSSCGSFMDFQGFILELRKSIRCVKNRHFKQEYCRRNKEGIVAPSPPIPTKKSKKMRDMDESDEEEYIVSTTKQMKTLQNLKVEEENFIVDATEDFEEILF